MEVEGESGLVGCICKDRYRFSFMNISNDLKKTFQESACILIISLNQEVYSGEKFITTLNGVSKYFKYCTIMIADTLQKYSIGIKDTKLSDMELEGKAFEWGNLWLENNIEIIKSSLTIPYRISRWEEWKKDKVFNNYYQEICSLYDNDQVYKHILNKEISKFLSRIKYQFDYDLAKRLSLQYLLEECAIMCLWLKEKSNFQLYPKGLNKAMSYINNILIQTKQTNLLQEVGFQIRKVK